MTSVVEMFEQTLRRIPDAPAVSIGGADTSYRQLHQLSHRVAAGLAAQGVSPGDRVALWLPNGAEWLASFLALCRLGAILVAVNTRYRAAEIEDLLGRSGAKLLVMQPAFRHIDFPGILAGVDPKALPELRTIVTLGTGDRILDHPTLPWQDLLSVSETVAGAAAADLPCIIFTTSGTTRGAKLVLHAQRSIAAHARDIAARFGLADPAARLLCFLPFCGVFGLVGAMAGLAAGTPLIAMDSFDAAKAADLARQQAITHCFGSDDMFRHMLEAAPDDGPPFPAARCFGYAAFDKGGLDFPLAACGRGMPLLGLYGSSEVQALFAAEDDALPVEERLRPGGRPIAGPAAQVRVRDLDSGGLAPPDVGGELEIRTPNQFLGYFGDAEATAQAITADGFFRTGDLARLRPDGSFIFEARLGDALRLGGYLVSPGEIEAELKTVPGIADAQVVGIRIGGTLRPVAFVIPTDGFSSEAALAHCRSRLARYKLPARIWTVQAFPVTASPNGSKVQRGRLRQMGEQRLAAEGKNQG